MIGFDIEQSLPDECPIAQRCFGGNVAAGRASDGNFAWPIKFRWPFLRTLAHGVGFGCDLFVNLTQERV
jgi:hypothetical protein